MTRSTPTREHAAGMLKALTASHVCTEACNGSITRPDGSVLQLVCPYSRLDMDIEGDRRIVQTMYASEARAAMGRS